MQEALEKLEGEKKPEPMGPLFGIVIIVALLVVGGVYFIIHAQSRAPEQLPYITNDPAATSSTTDATSTSQ